VTELMSRPEAPVSSGPLFPIEDPCWIPKERYLDRGFFDAERERLWPHVWQMACRLEEIPDVGDYVEYTIVDVSVIVVRNGPDPSDIKAFHNVCPHRATQLAVGSGSFRGRQIVCPFHGWRWNIDGSSSLKYGGESFRPECVTDAELALHECLLDTWGGCVFINLDRDAGPLQAQLAPMASLLDPLRVGDMKVRWWKGVRLKTNWKMAQEAFLEGWHVMQTHPQLSFDSDPERYSSDLIDYFQEANGNSYFIGKPDHMAGVDVDDVVASTIDSLTVLGETLESYPLPRDLYIAQGLRGVASDLADFQQQFTTRLFDYYAGAGMPLPQLEPEAYLRWGGVFFMFPNYFILPMFGEAQIYRARPDGNDPEACYFELWAVSLKPDHEPVGRAHFDGVFDKADTQAWPLVPRQDFSNVERQQRGLHSPAIHALRLSEGYEQNIPNMHRELDRYLSG
jgi:phenylpropionate dioxygenase-like ring-hydroxylating dioxygenase large terminal subunit